MKIRLDEIKCPINHTSKDFYGAVQTALLKTSEGLKMLNEKFGPPINLQSTKTMTNNKHTMKDNNSDMGLEIDKKNRICDNNENSKNQSELSNINTDLIIINSTNVRILKKSLDARKKPRLFFIFSVEVFWDEPVEVELCNSLFRLNSFVENERIQNNTSDECNNFQKNAQGKEKIFDDKQEINKEIQTIRPVVVGSGPAGLFAALTLALNGLKPILIERGKDVDARVRDINEFWDKGILLPESNVQFGEGGAGTFSDGKLTTGIKDPACRSVLETFVDAGAPIEILSMSKPHIGTDLLRDIVKKIRGQIELLGGTVLFETKLTGIQVFEGRINAINIESNTNLELLKDIVLSDKLRNETASSADITNPITFSIKSNSLVLAIGHSARDTIRMLNNSGLEMHAKPFSMGVRIEHSQKTINESQYGKQTQDIERLLPAAEYKLSCHLPDGRDVYTFCMCPGGQVIASASGECQVVTNGMSLYDRAQENANSAILVNVNPSDFEGDSPLSGIDFQEKWERKAFIAGGSCYKAPAQYVGDFLKNIKTSASERTDTKINTAFSPNSNIRANSNVNANPKYISRTNNGNAQNNNISSNKNNNRNNNINSGNNMEIPMVVPTYTPGVTWTNLAYCLPDFVTESILSALPIFERKLAGFASPGAVMTGIESRSSSPVRILRNAEKMANIEGIFPCGEGAGYAGGIMSAAVDGILCAKACIGNNNRTI